MLSLRTKLTYLLGLLLPYLHLHCSGAKNANAKNVSVVSGTNRAPAALQGEGDRAQEEEELHPQQGAEGKAHCKAIFEGLQWLPLQVKKKTKKHLPCKHLSSPHVCTVDARTTGKAMERAGSHCWRISLATTTWSCSEKRRHVPRRTL